MDVTGLLIFLAIGAVAGFLAGQVMQGGGYGLIADIVIGVIGAVFGGFVFGLLGITMGGLLGQIIMATVGAILLILVTRVLKRA